MFYKLRDIDYHKVRDLFIDLDFNNQIFSILDGFIPNDVFVDNLNYPKNAVIFAKWRIFFGGYSVNTDFIDAVADYLLNEYPNIVEDKKYARFLRLYWPNEEWKNIFLTKFKEPITFTRRFYIIHDLAISNWRELIPEGYTIEQIDDSILTSKEIINLDWLYKEIGSEWDTKEDFLQTGGGFCVLKESREMICWCTFEHQTKDNKIECAVATKEEYQQQGLATLAVSAAVEFALRKYEEVGWHCSSDNVPSWKLAEKVGFILDREYKVFEFYTNQIDNKIFHGYIELNRNNYEDSINFYEQALRLIQEEGDELEKSVLVREHKITPASMHFRLGTLWAALGKNDNAFKHLNTAINLGFKDTKRFLTEPLLEDLRDVPNWNTLISRLPKEEKEE